jgi:hypothetical protein
MSTTDSDDTVPESAVEGLRPHAWKSARSPYGWMSERDGEILKAILLNSGAVIGRRLYVAEWGSGQSTLALTRMLDEHGVCCHWLALEYDRAFFDATLAPTLLTRPGTVLQYVDDLRTGHGPDGDVRVTIEAVCWNRTALRPALDDHAADRDADLDEYVHYPAASRAAFDIIIVDGRMRRRCLLAAADLIGPQAVVLLHDAWHFHYQCALGKYPASRFLGDELWIGALDGTSIDRVLVGC